MEGGSGERGTRAGITRDEEERPRGRSSKGERAKMAREACKDARCALLTITLADAIASEARESRAAALASARAAPAGKGRPAAHRRAAENGAKLVRRTMGIMHADCIADALEDAMATLVRESTARRCLCEECEETW